LSQEQQQQQQQQQQTKRKNRTNITTLNKRTNSHEVFQVALDQYFDRGILLI
jgi:hypothetical protein